MHTYTSDIKVVQMTRLQPFPQVVLPHTGLSLKYSQWNCSIIGTKFQAVVGRAHLSVTGAPSGLREMMYRQDSPASFTI